MLPRHLQFYLRLIFWEILCWWRHWEDMILFSQPKTNLLKILLTTYCLPIFLLLFPIPNNNIIKSILNYIISPSYLPCPYTILFSGSQKSPTVFMLNLRFSSMEALGRIPFLTFSTCILLHSLAHGPLLHLQAGISKSPSASSHHLLLRSQIYLCLLRMSVIAFATYRDNPGYSSCLKIVNSIISEETPSV